MIDGELYVKGEIRATNLQWKIEKVIGSYYVIEDSSGMYLEARKF